MTPAKNTIWPMNQRSWRHWIRNNTLGDLVIMGSVAAIGRLLMVNYSQTMAVDSGERISWVILLLAGIAEGSMIGVMEWRSIRKLTALNPGAWITFTIVAAVLGWLLILAPAIVYISFLSKFTEINHTYFAIYAGIAGLSFGTLIGIPQYLILQRPFRSAVFWIFANAVAWMLSLTIIYSAVALFAGAPFFNIIITVAACMFSGLVQGSVTGLCLHYAMAPRQTQISRAETA